MSVILSILIPNSIASMLSRRFDCLICRGQQKGPAVRRILSGEPGISQVSISGSGTRCVPHEDGAPKASIYISVYRVLEHVPITELGKLYVVTQDGRTLGLEHSEEFPVNDDGLHLYKEIAPVTPLIASRLNAIDFFDLIVRNPTSLVTLPAVAFTELRLGELATIRF